MKNKYIKQILSAMVAFFILSFGYICNAEAIIEEESQSVVERADVLLKENSVQNLFHKMFSMIKKTVKEFSKVFASLLFTAFMLGILNLVTENAAAIYGGEICLCSISFSIVSKVTDNIGTLISALQSFMLSLLPTMTALYTASGASSMAAMNYSSTVLWMNVCSSLFSLVIVPSIKCVTIFAVVTLISRSFDFSGFSRIIKNTVGWIFGLTLCVMSGVIALQNIVGNAKDGLAGRALRFAASRFIPIIGNTVSESARTVSESIRLVRSVTGVSGIFAIMGIASAPIVALLVCRFFINLCSAVLKLFSCNKTGIYMDELCGALNLLLGVCIGIVVILIMILGIFAKAVLQI